MPAIPTKSEINLDEIIRQRIRTEINQAYFTRSVSLEKDFIDLKTRVDEIEEKLQRKHLSTTVGLGSEFLYKPGRDWSIADDVALRNSMADHLERIASTFKRSPYALFRRLGILLKEELD
jgi:hypothetical protein